MKLKKYFYMLSLVPFLAFAYWWKKNDKEDLQTRIKVKESSFVVSSDYSGILESSNRQRVFSRLNQSAVLLFLEAEGVRVTNGQLIASFDDSVFERELNRISKDCILAESKLERIEKAELPLALKKLESTTTKLRNKKIHEELLLKESRELQLEGLVSEQECKQQEASIRQMEKEIKDLEKQLQLTRDYIFPARLAEAKAQLHHAEQERELIRNQLKRCQIKAGKNGTIIYQPLHLNNEYRTARVGDTLYRNQTFALVADMSELIVTCYIPEMQISNVRIGYPAEVMPLSYPYMTLSGEIQHVGAMAHNLAGRPAWQKFFRATIRLIDPSPMLRSGMSVNLRVESYRRQKTLLVPRQAIHWKGEKSYCMLPNSVKHSVQVGMANETHYEVLMGLEAGDQILLP